MVKTRKIEGKRTENEEKIMAMTMTKTIITKIIIVMMRVRIKSVIVWKYKNVKTIKSVQVKVIHICLKWRNFQKATKENIIIKNNKTKVVVGAYLSREKKEKKVGYMIPTMNCYPRNG